MSVPVALVTLTLLAHAAPLSTETDRPYAGHAVFRLGDGTLTLEGQQVVTRGGGILVDRLLGPPVNRADVLCAADEGDDGLGRLRCWNERRQPVTLATGGRPSRLALGAAHLAWVASPEGLPQVFVAPLDASAPSRALTNLKLQRVPGRAPAGFVPPPLRQTLRFEGDLLRWEAQDGAHEVRWR